MKSIKKKNGFTLIELLAVIIILGVLLLVAIPSVTTYINNSRKETYIDTAKNIIKGATNLVNTGDLDMFDTDTTYYMPSSCISLETGGNSPFGEFDPAYVIVTYDNESYYYYWISRDTAGQGISKITSSYDLKSSLIEAGIKKTDITPNIGVGSRSKILVLSSEDCKSFAPETLQNSVPDGGGNSGGGSTPTAAETISQVEGLVNIADAKRYVGPTPSNYVSFNNGQSWRIIGVYGNRLKIISTTSIQNQSYNTTTPNPGWENSRIAQYLNNDSTGYYSTLSADAKSLIDTGTWNSGACDYDINASSAFSCSKNNISSSYKVGMLALYEYLYAADPSCYNTSGFSYYYYNNGCGSKDWLNTAYVWLMTPYAGMNTNAIYLDYYGSSRNNSVMSWYTIIPVVYLKSSVKITGGTGISTDPYILGM